MNLIDTIQSKYDNEQNTNSDSKSQTSSKERLLGSRTTFTRDQRILLEKGLLS